jgi:hypothetical protein
MSLPEELERQDGPARRFFEERFPGRAAVKRDVRQQTRGAETIRPSGNMRRLGTVGIAFHYRVQLCFLTRQEMYGERPGIGAQLLTDHMLVDPVSGSGASGLAAGRGAQLLIREGVLSHESVQELSETLYQAARTLAGRNRKLVRADEDEVCRLCFALALLEEVRARLLPGALLATLPRPATVDELLGLADAGCVADLRRIAWRFYDTQPELLAGDAILSPILSGTFDIGADPDLIVDWCLIEIKTAVDPGSISKPSWPWQLLGYALLDYDDAFEVDSVGLYLARQGVLVRWPLDEYIRVLAGREVPLAAARRDLQRALRPAGKR